MMCSLTHQMPTLLVTICYGFACGFLFSAWMIFFLWRRGSLTFQIVSAQARSHTDREYRIDQQGPDRHVDTNSPMNGYERVLREQSLLQARDSAPIDEINDEALSCPTCWEERHPGSSFRFLGVRRSFCTKHVQRAQSATGGEGAYALIGSI